MLHKGRENRISDCTTPAGRNSGLTWRRQHTSASLGFYTGTPFISLMLQAKGQSAGNPECLVGDYLFSQHH